MPRLLLLVLTTSYRISDFLGAARRLDVEVTVGSNRRQVLEKFSPDRTVTLDFRNSKRARSRSSTSPAGTLSRLSSRSMKTPRCWRLRPRRPWACRTIRPAPSGAANKYRFRTVLAGSWPPLTRFHRRIARGRPCRGGPSCRISLRPQAARAFRQPRRDPGRRSGRVCRRVLSYRKNPERRLRGVSGWHRRLHPRRRLHPGN